MGAERNSLYKGVSLPNPSDGTADSANGEGIEWSRDLAARGKGCVALQHGNAGVNRIQIPQAIEAAHQAFGPREVEGDADEGAFGPIPQIGFALLQEVAHAFGGEFELALEIIFEVLAGEVTKSRLVNKTQREDRKDCDDNRKNDKPAFHSMASIRLRLVSTFFMGLGLAAYVHGEVPRKSTKEKISEIHSYEKDFPWTRLLRDAFRAEVGKAYEYEDHYLNAKTKPLDESRLKQERDQLLETFQKDPPKLVFLTDDLAVSQFAGPLCERKIPFVFAGLNGEIPAELAKCASKAWGGVLERYYVRDSLRLLTRVLGKKSLRVLALLEDSETSRSVIRHLEAKAAKVPGVQLQTYVSSSFSQWKEIIEKQPGEWDAFFPVQPYALHDEAGNPLKGAEVVSWITQHSPRPTVYTASWHIRCGGMLAITHEPSAQGRFAGQQAKRVLTKGSGIVMTPPLGDIELNTATAAKLKIEVPFDLLSSATLHKHAQTPCAP